MSNKKIIEQETYFNDNILDIMYSIVKQCSRYSARSDSPDIIGFVYAMSCKNSLSPEKTTLRFLADITNTFTTEASKNAYDNFINFIQSDFTIPEKIKNNLIKMINIVLENNRDFKFTDTLTEKQISETEIEYKRTVKLRFEDCDEKYKVSYKWTKDDY